jgi:hypothetical protein
MQVSQPIHSSVSMNTFLLMIDSLLCTQGVAGQAKSHPVDQTGTHENQGARVFVEHISKDYGS